MKHKYTRKASPVTILEFQLGCPIVKNLIFKETKHLVKGTLVEIKGLGVKQYALVDHKLNKIFLRFGDIIVEEVDGTIYVIDKEKFEAEYEKL